MTICRKSEETDIRLVISLQLEMASRLSGAAAVTQSTPRRKVKFRSLQTSCCSRDKLTDICMISVQRKKGQRGVLDYGFMSVQIQTIKQGHLLKRSSNLRSDWKRRFFVLDSRGPMRKQWGKPTVSKMCLALVTQFDLVLALLNVVLEPLRR